MGPNSASSSADRSPRRSCFISRSTASLTYRLKPPAPVRARTASANSSGIDTLTFLTLPLCNLPLSPTNTEVGSNDRMALTTWSLGTESSACLSACSSSLRRGGVFADRVGGWRSERDSALMPTMLPLVATLAARRHSPVAFYWYLGGFPNSAAGLMPVPREERE